MVKVRYALRAATLASFSQLVSMTPVSSNVPLSSLWTMVKLSGRKSSYGSSGPTDPYTKSIAMTSTGISGSKTRSRSSRVRAPLALQRREKGGGGAGGVSRDDGERHDGFDATILSSFTIQHVIVVTSECSRMRCCTRWSLACPLCSSFVRRLVRRLARGYPEVSRAAQARVHPTGSSESK